jgi:phospholipase/carboxylesterase
MNRIPAFGYVPSNTSVQVVESRNRLSEVSPFDLPAPYAIFYPKHFEPRYAYPLLIWLHSPDSSEFEVNEVAPAVSFRNYIAIGLRGTEVSRQRKQCFRWSTSQYGRMLSEETVMMAIQLATQDLHINRSQIFLGGYGLGGSIAQWVGLRNPNEIAGVISINGPIPDKPQLLASWRIAKSLPVMFMYGESSTLCSTDAVSEAIHFTHRSCLNYQFCQFNCGDDLDVSMTTMMDRFMMKSVTQ